jgi:hypothetical protein
LGKHCERVAEAEDNRAIKAEQLSWSISEIFDTQLDLNMHPIWDIPSQSWLAKDVMVAFNLILEWLWEEALVHKPDA